MSEKTAITLTINGRDHAIGVEPRRTLGDAIREDCGQTGTHIGCEHGICGACTVIVDGEPVRSCLMFAVQADGKKIRTVEGLANGDELHPMQRAFMEHHGLQCGFCTPGFLMLAVGVLEREPDISDDDLHRRAVVEPVPLHRLPEHHQGGARGGQRDARREREHAASEIRRPLGAAAGRSPAADRPGPLRRRYFISRSVAHARGALAGRARHDCTSIDASAALALPGVHAVWTHADVAHIPPIDVSPDRAQDTRALSAAGAGAGRRALCRRAGRGGVRGRCLSRRGRRRAGRAVDIEQLPRRCCATDRARRLRRAIYRPNRRLSAKGLWRCRRRFRSAHAIVALELSIGRHSGVPLETRGAIARYDADARRAGNARRRQSAALEPRRASRRCSAAPRTPCIFTKAMSAAASAFAASFIPRMCWSAPRR